MKRRACTFLFLSGVVLPLIAAAVANDVPPGVDVDTWRQIESTVSAEVEAERAAGEDQTLRGGITAVHGLIRREVLVGNYDDLPPQDAPDGPEFGYSVAMDGDWLAVGAPGTVWTHVIYGTAAHGAVFVFRRQGGTWSLIQRILRTYETSGTMPGSRCGHAVALRVPHLVFGCPEMMAGGQQRRGRVVTMRLSESNTFVPRVSQSGPDAGGRCGAALALSNNYLAVGCPTNGGDSGRVHIVRRDAASNDFPLSAPETVLTPDADVFGFGWSLALREPPAFTVLEPQTVRLAIGAPNTVYPGTIWPRGSVFVYARLPGVAAWSLNSTMRPAPSGSDGAALARFGEAVAMNRDQLLIGAPNNRWGSIPVPGPGSAHRYELTSMTGSWTWQFRQDTSLVNLPDGGDNGQRFGAALALGFNNLIAVGGPGVSSVGGTRPEVGLVEIRRSNFDEWNLHSYWGELRPASTPAHNRANFGASLNFDVSGRTLAVGVPGHRIPIGIGPLASRGQVWLYVEDAIFDNGFQCAPGLAGC